MTSEVCLRFILITNQHVSYYYYKISSLLHDPTFDDELRRAAVYISDRHILFKLVEEAHYRLIPQQKQVKNQSATSTTIQTAKEEQDRTTSLIDNFLEQIPEEAEREQETAGVRKPTPADATVDYVAIYWKSESKQKEEVTPQLRGQETNRRLHLQRRR